LLCWAFVHLRTHDDALSELRRQVAEQADVLGDLRHSGGDAALRNAIADSLADDPQMVAALIDPAGDWKPAISAFPAWSSGGARASRR
jgi:hypothetical protein